MERITDKTNRGFVEHWRRVGPLLERIQKQELREFCHEEHWQEVDALLEIAAQNATVRTTSGLVQWQRALGKSRP